MADADPLMDVVLAAERGIRGLLDRAMNKSGVADDHMRRTLKAIIFMRGYANTWPLGLGAAPLEDQALKDFRRAIESLKLEATPNADTDHDPNRKTH